MNKIVDKIIELGHAIKQDTGNDDDITIELPSTVYDRLEMDFKIISRSRGEHDEMQINGYQTFKIKRKVELSYGELKALLQDLHKAYNDACENDDGACHVSWRAKIEKRVKDFLRES